MSPVPVAFYAPLKAPDHPLPSGDRTMARLLIAALAAAGFAPSVASNLRTWDATGAGHAALRAASEREVARLLAALAAGPRPKLWFTYHVYYKAPDWIGPAVAAALDIPYVIAEGSRAGKRAKGPFALGHAGAETALNAAHLVLAMTRHDREALARARPAGQILADLPPFVAAADPSRPGRPPGGRRLLAVGMMRGGDKLASYRLLAQTLLLLRTPDWTLDVVGDGPSRGEIAARLAPFGARLHLHGALAPPALARLYAEADLLVWPAVNEAYGMALLEAQSQSCPVVAGDYGGVRDALRDGITGLVVPPGDAMALARGVDALLADPARRAAMAAAARHFAREDRGPAQAAARLRRALMPLVAAQDDRGQSLPGPHPRSLADHADLHPNPCHVRTCPGDPDTKSAASSRSGWPGQARS